MTLPPSIDCKPTRWFLSRAVAIFLMFSVFAVLFYIDGSTGYRKKNEVFYLHQSFQVAGNEFAEMNSGQSLTPQEWEMHAKKQSVPFPQDHSILPRSIEVPMPWPAVLTDFESMKSLQWNKLWLDYSAERGFDAKPAEHPYDARKIREQWIVFTICTGLSLATLFFLVRTLGRRISADQEALTSPAGKRVPYTDMTRLDLRKWDTKGIARVDYENANGKGTLRIDGLTYGGFNKDQGEPAEMLMSLVRSKFSGELLAYEAVESTGEEKQDA